MGTRGLFSLIDSYSAQVH